MDVRSPASLSILRGSPIQVDGLPLRLGDEGAAVRDLHLRLAEAGFAADSKQPEMFSASTDDALRSFQESRGLETDGICGRQTWSALAEARYRLGDRLIYLQSPMLRGDDVAELQRRLGSLGFDAGRVDGIFGPDTRDALEAFQRNVGLNCDGICGPGSVGALNRLGGRDQQDSVASVRERHQLRETVRDLGECRVVIGEFGGLDGVVATVSRSLNTSGANVSTIRHPDGSHHARVTNQMDAAVYIGLHQLDEPGCTVSYFATEGFVSYGGRHLTQLLCEELATSCGVEPIGRGLRLPVLRETRMPAVVVRIGPPKLATEQGPNIAAAVREALTRWLAEPIPDENR